jgi:hypothetical protein
VAGVEEASKAAATSAAEAAAALAVAVADVVVAAAAGVETSRRFAPRGVHGRFLNALLGKSSFSTRG